MQPDRLVREESLAVVEPQVLLDRLVQQEHMDPLVLPELQATLDVQEALVLLDLQVHKVPPVQLDQLVPLELLDKLVPLETLARKDLLVPLVLLVLLVPQVPQEQLEPLVL